MSHPTLDIDLNPTIGVLEIGSLLSVCLFGVVTVQCHTYFNRFPNDWWLFKLLVTIHNNAYQWPSLTEFICYAIGIVYLVCIFILLLSISLSNEGLVDRLLELGHTIGVSYEIYRATITHYGHPEKLVQFHGLSGTVILGGLITMLVQVRQYKLPWRKFGD